MLLFFSSEASNITFKLWLRSDVVAKSVLHSDFSVLQFNIFQEVNA